MQTLCIYFMRACVGESHGGTVRAVPLSTTRSTYLIPPILLPLTAVVKRISSLESTQFHQKLTSIYKQYMLVD